MKKVKLLSIDPGTIKSGYCYWENNVPIKWGLMEGKTGNWLTNVTSILDQYDSLCHELRITHAIIELPEYWQGPEGYAARESGSLFKLVFFVGSLYTHIRNQCLLSSVELITPSKWKGQLPKHVVRKRLMKQFPDIGRVLEELDHNVIDAIGIGNKYLQNILKKKDKEREDIRKSREETAKIPDFPE